MTDDLPDGYPHENAIYMNGELVELVGANTFEFEAQNGDTLTSHEVYWSWWDEEDEFNGIQKERLAYFKADGGLLGLHETLLSLPPRRVQGRDRLQQS